MKSKLLTCLVLLSVVAGPHAAAFAAAEEASIQQLIDLTKAQSYNKASNLYDKLSETDPNNVRLRLVGANMFRQMGMFARAMTEYKRLLHDDPKLLDPMIALSQMNMEYLDIPASLNMARRAVATNSASSNARIALCSSLIASDYLKEAEEQLQKLHKDVGNNAEVDYIAYKLNLKRGQLSEARKQLESVLKSEPNNGEWLLDLSDLCRMQGNLDEATVCLQRALDADPISIDKINRMAILQEYSWHDYDKAMEMYQRILAIDPDSVTALAGMDRCRAKKNDIAAALKNELRNWFSSINKALSP